MNVFDSLAIEDISQIVELAWSDSHPFQTIQSQFGLSEDEVVELMKKEAGLFLYYMWSIRVNIYRSTL